MSFATVLVGCLVAGVYLLVLQVLASRRTRLADRIAPFVRSATTEVEKQRALPEDGSTFSALRRLVLPFVRDLARVVERSLGGSRSVQRRLTALGDTLSVEGFRIEQVIWGVVGAGFGVLLTFLLLILEHTPSLFIAVFLGAGGLLVGVLGRDWWLSQQVKRREAAMMAEFPVVAELLALAITAGESPLGAITRVTQLSRGELSRELKRTLADARSGKSVVAALQGLSDRTTLEPLVRFVDGVVIALQRGTPLADVMRAQARDARDAGKRELMASGGRREIAMMMPVVFLVLPITVVFALYPGLVHISLLAE